MLKLFKYEMRKTLMSKLILLGLTAGLEGYFLYGVFSGNVNSATIASILLLVLAIMGVLFIGVQSIVTLHHDMNTKQSYMLFMTPHSNYAILGAKALECTVSVVLATLFFFGLGVLDVRILFDKFGDIKQLTDFVQQMMTTMSIPIDLNAAAIIGLVFQSGTGWIETVMVAFLCDVVATSLLKGKKIGGLVTFVLFLALSGVAQKVAELIHVQGSLAAYVSGGVLLAFAVAEYVATAVIMEKKLSV